MNKLQNTLCDCTNCVIRNLYFEFADIDELRKICAQKTQIKYHKGDTVINEGQDINHFIYLKSGLLKYHLTLSNGKTQILDIARPYDPISLLNLYNTSSIYSASAVIDSVVCYIPLDSISTMILNNGKFAMNFTKKMNDTANTLILKQLEIKSKNIFGRVASILLEFSDDIFGHDEFNLPISRKDIAEIIGMTTENVIRTLSEFRHDGIIQIDGKKITILNKDTLKKISKNG